MQRQQQRRRQRRRQRQRGEVRHGAWVLVFLGSWGLFGCGGALFGTPDAEKNNGDTATQGQTVQRRFRTTTPPVLGARVVQVEDTGCEGVSVSEVCAGRSDDCGGVVREACAYQAGSVQVTIGWAMGGEMSYNMHGEEVWVPFGPDVDLYVTDPSGETISQLRPTSPGAGQLNHEGRGFCKASGDDSSDDAEAMENAIWSGPELLAGVYRVSLHYWGGCVSDPGWGTDVTISVSVGGKVVGSYTYPLGVSEYAADVLAFRVDEVL